MKPDQKKAISLIRAAKLEMNFTLSLDITEDSASTILRNIYECFRMLGASLLTAEGKDFEDHV